MTEMYVTHWNGAHETHYHMSHRTRVSVRAVNLVKNATAWFLVHSAQNVKESHPLLAYHTLHSCSVHAFQGETMLRWKMQTGAHRIESNFTAAFHIGGRGRWCVSGRDENPKKRNPLASPSEEAAVFIFCNVNFLSSASLHLLVLYQHFYINL